MRQVLGVGLIVVLLLFVSKNMHTVTGAFKPFGNQWNAWVHGKKIDKSLIYEPGHRRSPQTESERAKRKTKKTSKPTYGVSAVGIQSTTRK
jgi:hypothetical protein